MKLVMFDMDGTLYRTETSFFPAVQEFAAEHGFAAPDEEFLRGFIGQNNGGAWRSWIEQLQLGQPTDGLLQEFEALEKQLVQEKGQLYPGATTMLREIASDGWILGICSNAPAWYPEVILTGAGVRDLFAQIRVPRRPEETKSMMLCEVWNELHPERCVMVGDRADDMRAAHAGGFVAIGAAYGWAPDELEHADVLVHAITDIPAALAGQGEATTPQNTPVEAAATPEKPPEPAPVAVEKAEPLVAPEPTAATPAPPATTPAAEPVAEPAVARQPEKAPEPVPQPPVVAKPVTPVQPPAEPIHQPMPPSAPRPVPPSPEPPQEPDSAPVRRSWNPFRRRDDRSR